MCNKFLYLNVLYHTKSTNMNKYVNNKQSFELFKILRRSEAEKR